MDSMNGLKTQTVVARPKTVVASLEVCEIQTVVARPEVCETDDEKHQMLLLSSTATGNDGTPSSHTGNNGPPSSHTGPCVKMNEEPRTTEGSNQNAQQMSMLTISPRQQAGYTSVHSSDPTTQNKNAVPKNSLSKQESFIETDSDPSIIRQSANIQGLNDFPNYSGTCVSRNITQHISSEGNFSQLTSCTRLPVHILTISSDSINGPVFPSPLQNSPIQNPPVFYIPQCGLSPSIQRPHLNNVVYPLQESKIYSTLPRKDSLDSGLSADGGSLQSSSLDSLSSVNSCSISTESTPNKLDMLLINTDDDIELADSFTEHLKTELDIDGLTVDKFCDIGVGGTALQGLDTIHDRYSHILILVTDNLVSDRHKRFLTEILLTCGLREKNGKEDRVVPVWTTRDSKNKILELSIIRGLDYHAFLTSKLNCRKNNYKECVRKLVNKGRQINS